jgi:hypothetical protein
MMILPLTLSLLGCAGPDTDLHPIGSDFLVLPSADAEYDDPAAIQTFSTLCSGSIQSCIDAART